MEGFDSASFWIGLALGLLNGAAAVCFFKDWRRTSRLVNVNPPAPIHSKPVKAPVGPPPAPPRKHYVEVRAASPNRPDYGPDLRR